MIIKEFVMFGITSFERNDLWNQFRDFEKEFFRGFGADDHFRIDIKNEGDKYLLECEMPGFDKNDIKVDVNVSTLTLCAEHKTKNDEKKSSGEYISRESSYGSYCRSFDVSNTNENAVNAEYTNGFFKFTLPKKDRQ